MNCQYMPTILAILNGRDFVHFPSKKKFFKGWKNPRGIKNEQLVSLA